MTEYREGIGELERRQLIYPRTSTPDHKDYNSEEVNDGSWDSEDALVDSTEAQDGTQVALDAEEELGDDSEEVNDGSQDSEDALGVSTEPQDGTQVALDAEEELGD